MTSSILARFELNNFSKARKYPMFSSKYFNKPSLSAALMQIKIFALMVSHVSINNREFIVVFRISKSYKICELQTESKLTAEND